MAGTQIGGRKAATTNKQRYGSGEDGRPNFYSLIGRKGGLISRNGGFSGNPEAARIAGSIGGQVSRRGPRRTDG